MAARLHARCNGRYELLPSLLLAFHGTDICAEGHLRNSNAFGIQLMQPVGFRNIFRRDYL